MARSRHGHLPTLNFKRNRLVIGCDDHLGSFLHSLLWSQTEIRRFCRVCDLVVVKCVLFTRLHDFDLSGRYCLIQWMLGRRYQVFEPTRLSQLWRSHVPLLLGIVIFVFLWGLFALSNWRRHLGFTVQPLHISAVNPMIFYGRRLTLVTKLVLLNFCQDLRLVGKPKYLRTNGFDIFVFWHMYDLSGLFLFFLFVHPWYRSRINLPKSTNVH